MGLDDSQTEIMEAFQTHVFIETNNENYRDIENVARNLGMVE